MTPQKWYAKSRRQSLPYVLIAPAAVVMLAIVAVPLIEVVRLSFSQYNFITEPEFVGLRNYVYLVSQDPRFWTVVRNTAIWTVVSVFLEYILALGVALLLNQRFRLRNLFRGLLLLPWIVPPVTAGLIWLTLYDADNGIINKFLKAVGLPPQNWLADSDLALFSLIVVAVWKYMPFMIVALLAGLQSIPQHLYEAAAIDGASGLQQFRYITLPMLLPVSTVVIVLGVIWRAGHFDLVYMLTGGGPAGASELVATYAFEKTIDRLEAGMGAAVALLGVAGILIFIWYYVKRLLRS